MAKQTTRLRMLKESGPVPINPATEETLENIDNKMDNLIGFEIPPFDYIGVTYPTTTREVYTYRTGGNVGTVVAVITVEYNEVEKINITSVAKT
jgi:hypothetical protein